MFSVQHFSYVQMMISSQRRQRADGLDTHHLCRWLLVDTIELGAAQCRSIELRDMCGVSVSEEGL